ncbi:MAG: DUF4924 family protein [Bacteroidales bacterium]|nr:DUF4924 family protein [Candidatus Sodaliphilus aphodohippi]
MLIAQQKRKDNIAEYLLYMWQVEDIIRASQLNIDTIEQTILSKYNVSDEIRMQMRDWWESLIKMMQLENAQNGGHLQINKNVIIRLTDLHLSLLNNSQYPEYGADFYRTLPFIVELRSKSGNGEQAGELETCFNALYGYLVLKLKGQEVSNGTATAMAQISHFIGLLAAYYKKYETGTLKLD